MFEEKKLYADIVFSVPIDEAYQYTIPPELVNDIKPGKLVEAQFGRRKGKGCVLSVSDKPKPGIKKFRPLKRIITPDYEIDPELLTFSRWIADYYLCSHGEALSAVSFIGFADVRNPPIKALELCDNYTDTITNLPRKIGPKQQAIIDAFQKENTDRIFLEKIKTVYDISKGSIDSLIGKGIAQEVIVAAKPAKELAVKEYKGMPLTQEQQAAFEEISKSIHAQEYKTFLVHGVTGSGKTELYLSAINEALKIGKQAIVLVPEISLTPQTVHRFKDRFGDIVGVYHSRLTIREKFKLWELIKQGVIKIIVGARSALFTPFASLGLIILDEEHETTYKQETTPRYHARDTAIMRAHKLGAVVVLGSATPSMESYANAKKGKFTLLEMSKRIDDRKMPEVRIVDMTKELSDDQNVKQLSQPLIDDIGDRLRKNEQVIILLNRRGFNHFVLCMKCNKAVKCESCEITMTYHKKFNRLICHFCGKTMRHIETCPYCDSKNIVYMGAGTQRVEEELKQVFPDARMTRMDQDTMTSKHAYDHFWKKASNKEIDIILGTQMIAKGFDLENVTLVGILSADSPLYLPDFRSAERTFSLLTQVAGRAGRSHKGGEVIIQTYNTSHYSIKFAKEHDYKGFYTHEERIRRLLRFPPVMRIANILCSHAKEAKVREITRVMTDILRKACYKPEYSQIQILGPAAAPLEKLRDKFRWHLIVKSNSMKTLASIVRYGLSEFNKARPGQSGALTVDIDPISLM